ncbi:MAG: hypothetical protein PHE15_01695 [Dehalococcoidales bacterium]|nr:hypothetical protein [Dehalococcoidales bacterium]
MIDIIKELSETTTKQRIRIAVKCALSVCSFPSFVMWATKWLNGEETSCSASDISKRVRKVHSNFRSLADQAALSNVLGETRVDSTSYYNIADAANAASYAARAVDCGCNEEGSDVYVTIAIRDAMGADPNLDLYKIIKEVLAESEEA